MQLCVCQAAIPGEDNEESEAASEIEPPMRVVVFGNSDGFSPTAFVTPAALKL